ncbi:hypothetical protein COOONC_05614 [Cooperia oncophora]
MRRRNTLSQIPHSRTGFNTQSQAPDSGRGSPLDELAAGDHARIPSAMEIARRGTTNTFNDLQSARPSTRLLEVPEVETLEVKLVADGGGGGGGGGDDCYGDSFDCDGDFTLPHPPACEKRASFAVKNVWETEVDVDCTEKLLLNPFEASKWKTSR